ncbi:MAG: murein L,D-transpeptidase catalytic domain family protein [Nevskia sp.]|nr:murein L,D-transpeptidase catalytic domain family protein [Nevskia sp.]
MLCTWLCRGALGLLLCGAAHAADRATLPSLVDALLQVAPGANPQAVQLAVQAMSCAVRHGAPAAQRLGVIDFSRPSTERRLWVFDLQRRRLLFDEWVAHGRGSGEDYARRFSDDAGSLASSLGLFRTLQTYIGHNGYSLRLEGLEPGFNDHAYARAVVIHGARYVNAAFARRVGRLGRSFGCPAVREAIAQPLIDSLKDNQYLFAYYPDPHWLANSPYLHCDAPAYPSAAADAASPPSG